MSRILPHQSATKKLPASRPLTANISLLAVTPDQDDCQVIEGFLDHDGWTVQGAQSIREAATLMEEQPDLVLCERNLPDGSWKDVFRIAQRLDTPPPVVVVSRYADERFWAEVLNLGGYDVLLKPFVGNEVSRVLRMALRHAQEREPAYLCAAV